MKIKQYEAIISYIKETYPNLADRFEIWHDFDEGNLDPDLWAVYWGDDFEDPKFYSILIKLIKHYTTREFYKIEEKRVLCSDLKQQPETYLQKLEGIAASIRDCEDGGDIKYIVQDAEKVLKERKRSEGNNERTD